MESLLENDPNLIAGVGIVSARWAALERELSNLLGSLLRVRFAGDDAYYSPGNFTQRVELVRSIVRSSLKNKRHIKIAEALFRKIGRLWKTRNYLVHSHYVRLIEYADGTSIVETGPSPIKLGLVGKGITYSGFAYEAHDKDGEVSLRQGQQGHVPQPRRAATQAGQTGGAAGGCYRASHRSADMARAAHIDA